MLESLGPGGIDLNGARFLPPVLSPLIDAAERGEPLTPAVTSVVQVFGFDSFMYGASLSIRPDHEETSYVFTTLSPQWVLRYDQCAYIEVDPRILHVYDNAMPFVWDQSSERGKNEQTDNFLDDAAAHGVSSGVAFAVYSAVGGHVMVAFNSTKPIIDDLRRFAIMRNLGDLGLLSIYFHEMFMKRVIKAGLPPQSQGVPLSDNQKACVLWAAHGYTSRQIAAAFCISERMVDIHLSQARSKLGTANRHETTAKAVAAGIIRLGTLPPAPHAETHGVSERRKAYRVVK